MNTPSWLPCWIAAVALAAGCGGTAARHEIAVTPCSIALAPSAAPDPRVADLQQQARRARGGAHALEQLGFHYISRARRSNDPGDYTLAEHVAACLDLREPDHANGLLIRGHVLQQHHRFREAETLARKLVARREFVLDYGLLGDALMEQGKLTEAAAAYQRMIDIKPFYQSYIRAAHLRWLRGDRPGAGALVRQAIAAASPRDAEAVAWAYTRLAHYELQSGRLEASASAANAALASQKDYPAALLVRSRVHHAHGRSAEAVDDLRLATRLVPLPEYQWALADALQAANRPEEAAAVERELVGEGGRSDPRTLAMYLATRDRDTARAVQLAAHELDSRADVFTLDAYAWALAANGQLEEARKLMSRAVAEGTEDARLFLHAGSIAAAAGRRREARHWLAKAHLTRFTLLPSELDQLRAHSAQSIAQEN
jgi:tetratricopeptide (TPR) repeat protein